MLRITFIVSPSEKGKELFDRFKSILDTRGNRIRGCEVQLTKCDTYQMKTTLLACFNSDAVIFDGTIEDGKQYAGAIELLKFLDYVLIVSRNTLPINFQGLRKGGAPGFIRSGTTEYESEFTNYQIDEWLWRTFDNSNMELPRALRQDITEDYFNTKSKIGYISSIEQKIISESLSRCRSTEKRAFISYLSKYSKQNRDSDFPKVEDIFPIICDRCDIDLSQIVYFPPGVISMEFMTGERRSEIASLTEMFISKCNSFWIFETEDYYRSWWTFGELMSLRHAFNNNMENCPDIYVVKPSKGTHNFEVRAYKSKEDKDNFLPSLSIEQHEELERIYVNSNPETVSYENVKKMRQFAALPDFLLKGVAKMESYHMGAVMEQIVTDWNVADKNAFLEEIRNPDAFVKSVRSFAYSKSFWESHIVECPICKSNWNGQTITPEMYIHYKSDFFKTINPFKYKALMRDIIEKGKALLKLPCGHSVNVVQGEHYYRWWTVKNDVPTGPYGKLLERIDFLVLK